MPTNAQDQFTVAVKKRLVDLNGLTVTALARRIGKSRNVVSMAINHPVHPTVRKLIAKELQLKEPK